MAALHHRPSDCLPSFSSRHLVFSNWRHSVISREGLLKRLSWRSFMQIQFNEDDEWLCTRNDPATWQAWDFYSTWSMVDQILMYTNMCILLRFLFSWWLTRSPSLFTSEMWPECCYWRRSVVLVALSGSPRWGSILTPRSQMCSNSSQSTWPMHSSTMVLNTWGYRTSLYRPLWQIVSTSPWPRPWKRGSEDPPLVSALLCSCSSNLLCTKFNA